MKIMIEPKVPTTGERGFTVVRRFDGHQFHSVLSAKCGPGFYFSPLESTAFLFKTRTEASEAYFECKKIEDYIAATREEDKAWLKTQNSEVIDSYV